MGLFHFTKKCGTGQCGFVQKFGFCKWFGGSCKGAHPKPAKNSTIFEGEWSEHSGAHLVAFSVKICYHRQVQRQNQKGCEIVRKVLIVDPSEDWRNALSLELEQSFRVHGCEDGLQAMACIEEIRPDVLIVDLILSGIDGLSLVRKLHDRLGATRIIVTGCYFSSFAVSALERYQVEAILLKPCSPEVIRELITDMLDGDKVPVEQSSYDCITSLLVRLGARTSQQGFRFLRYGITLLMEDPFQQLTKRLYPAIAAEFGTTPINVEKAMRTTVTGAWTRRQDQVWRDYFAVSANGQIPKPTTGQFMIRMTDVVRCGWQKRVS